MELPLLALPDAPRAAEARPGAPPSGEEKRRACFTEEARNQAAVPTPKEAAEDMAKFLFGIAFRNTCKCNMEPERVRDRIFSV